MRAVVRPGGLATSAKRGDGAHDTRSFALASVGLPSPFGQRSFAKVRVLPGVERRRGDRREREELVMFEQRGGGERRHS